MAKIKRRFKITTDSKHNLPIAKNLLGQDFTADAPNKTWTGDITNNKRYCDKGLNSGHTAKKTTERVDISFRPGSHYASHEFRKFLAKHHFIQSMSGKGIVTTMLLRKAFSIH
jgi:transposase InsO family protein